MHIIDTHCDVLLKLYESKGKIKFKDSQELDINYNRLVEGDVKVQSFAIFVYPSMKAEEKWQAALDQIHYFYTDVLANNPKMKHIRSWEDFDQLQPDEIGAMLTLEGVDPIGNDLNKLSILKQLGVMMVGLTWNYANLAADGAQELRNGGLSNFGRELVQYNNENQLFTDVSHLCEGSFWDVMEHADYIIASHSNARKVCDHVRNLHDEQIEAMLKKDALIHLVYCPPFVAKGEEATIGHLVKHNDHIASLGGIQNIGLGSDFDGIENKVVGLTHAGESQRLIEELLKYYSEDEVKGIAHQNFLNHRPHLKK